MKKKEKLLEYRRELATILSKAGSSTELMNEFLLDIMTPAEFDEVALRWQVVKHLRRGETHRAIAEELGLGISTVSRGARELRNKKGGFARLLEKLGLR
jgi:TrpR family trp operon transcriptional repressor